jgi:hypothetical protein
MCRPLRKKAVVPLGEDVISIHSDDIVDEFDSDVVVDESREEEDYNNTLFATIRKASTPAQPSGKACPPAKPDGTRNNHFSPNDVVFEIDTDMETDVETINQGTNAQKRAAETAPQDNPRSKKAADPNAEDVDSWRNKATFTCLPDKIREWSRPGPKDGTAKFAPSKGWGLALHDVEERHTLY